MNNLYLLRTAAVASIAAALLTAGWMGLQSDDEMRVMSDAVAVSRMDAAPAPYFPAGLQVEIRPGAEDGQVHEYY